MIQEGLPDEVLAEAARQHAEAQEKLRIQKEQEAAAETLRLQQIAEQAERNRIAAEAVFGDKK